jgi:hypothetical protein
MRHVHGEWNGNLDAFNDYLSWPDDSPYRLTLIGWKACVAALNRELAPNGMPVTEVIDEILQQSVDTDIVYR